MGLGDKILVVDETTSQIDHTVIMYRALSVRRCQNDDYVFPGSLNFANRTR